MFAAHFFQQMNQWLPALSRLTQPTHAATAPAEQIILQYTNPFCTITRRPQS